jgi:hypothetical protein
MAKAVPNPARPAVQIGARIRQTARSIRVHLTTGWPWQALFSKLAPTLNTS